MRGFTPTNVGKRLRLADNQKMTLIKFAQQILRSSKLNTLTVYGALGLGFLLLIGLIVYLGNYGATRLEDLSRNAQEKTEAYSARLQQASALRPAVENAFSEARSYRTARENLRVYPVSFNSRLNAALKRLADEFVKTKNIRAQRGNEMSADEQRQLDELIGFAKPFFDFLAEDRERVNAEVRGTSASRVAQDITTPHDAEAATRLGKDADRASKKVFAEGLFFSTQNFLLVSVIAWEKRLDSERQNLLADIAQQQAAAAASVRSRMFWTGLVGCVIALATFLIARAQIKQIRTAENEAQEAVGLTTSVLNSLRDDVLAINEQGAVFSVNPAFLSDFHLARQECLHQDYRTLLAGLPVLRQAIEQAAQRASLATVSLERSAERLELKPDGAAGDKRMFDLEIAPRLVGEQTRGYVIVLTDVTEIERNREEAERNRALSRIGQLTAQVGHEIYNPLGAIKLNADLLEMQLPAAPDDARQTVTRLKSALEHLSTVVLDLRYLSRSREPERQTIELHALLDEVIALADERLQRTQTRIQRVYAPASLRGEFDPLQLRKVFLNLLINAIEASPHASEVTLVTRQLKATELTNGFKAERGALVVSVIDHGSGMSAETKRRVFEAFYSTKQHGTGLGMMITHEIVKKHGGKIEVESDEGHGTKMEVYLPL